MWASMSGAEGPRGAQRCPEVPRGGGPLPRLSNTEGPWESFPGSLGHLVAREGFLNRGSSCFEV